MAICPSVGYILILLLVKASRINVNIKHSLRFLPRRTGPIVFLQLFSTNFCVFYMHWLALEAKLEVRSLMSVPGTCINLSWASPTPNLIFIELFNIFAVETTVSKLSRFFVSLCAILS